MAPFRKTQQDASCHFWLLQNRIYNILKEEIPNEQTVAYYIDIVCVCVCLHVYVWINIQITNSQDTTGSGIQPK